MIREGRSGKDFGSIKLAERNFSSDRFSVPPSVGSRKLAVPLYFVDGFHRRAVNSTLDDSETDWAVSAKEARVQLQSRWDGILVTKEQDPCFEGAQ